MSPSKISPSQMSPSQMSPTPIIKDKRRTTKIKDIRSIYVIKWLFSQRQRTKDKKKVSNWFIRLLFKNEGRRTRNKGRRTRNKGQRREEIFFIHEAFFPGTKDQGRRTKRKKIRMINDYDSWGFSPKDDGQSTIDKGWLTNKTTNENEERDRNKKRQI